MIKCALGTAKYTLGSMHIAQPYVMLGGGGGGDRFDWGGGGGAKPLFSLLQWRNLNLLKLEIL